MKRLVKNQVLLAKVGSTPDTSDAVALVEPFSPSFDFKSGEYRELDGKMGTTKTYVVNDYIAVSGTVSCYLRTNGGGANVPKLDEMFKMSGFDGAAIDTDSDDENDTYRYTPNSDELANGNIIFYLDGIKRTFSNVSANLKFSFEVGMPAKVEFDIKGFSSNPTEEANPSVTLDDKELFIVTSAQAVTLSGNTLQLTKVDFDMQNDIKEVYAINVKEFYRSDFKAKVTLTEKVSDDISYISDFLNGNIKSLEVELTNSAGDKFRFIAPTMSYTNINESGSDELEVSREFLLNNDFYFEYK